MIPHLNCKTEYSLTHGLIRLDGEQELGKIAAERGIEAVAVTDANNVFAAVRHQQSCLRHGVKPILGCQAKFQRGVDGFEASLLCEDAKGFANLSLLLSEAQLDEQDDNKALKTDRLDSGRTAGLFLLLGYESDVCHALRNGAAKRAQGLLRQWKELFADGRLACALSFGGRQHEQELSLELAQLAHAAGVPVAASHPVLFPSERDFENHEVRACIANSWKLEDKQRPRPYTREQSLLGADQMRKKFARWPGALENAAEIALRCSYDFGLADAPQFPHLPNVKADEVDQRLREQAHEKLRDILAALPASHHQTYLDRLDAELDVITGKGFSGYFLIVADLVGFAVGASIPVGPGRGSGAGSLVAYALGITGIDPIKHDLLFERFLNPERTSLPDFDIDFCRDRRDEVIAHARDTYGENCVSQVATFGTLKAKAVVRDVCRVLGMPYGTGDTISRLIPTDIWDENDNKVETTLAAARGKVDELDRMLRSTEEMERMWSFCEALEGLPRQPSTHAAAVLISPKPIVEYCPVCRVGVHGKSFQISQYDMNAADKVGLIKFDILGLKNLTMLQLAEQLVRQYTPQRDFSLKSIDLTDDRMFKIYRSGSTVGVFQCESSGMISLLKKIQPRSIEDITVAISLFRPGAIKTKMDRTFLDNREKPAQIKYAHAKVRPVLEPTYGAMIYQEQLMRISQVLAGFSLAKADVMRAAIGKKDLKVMESLKHDFIAGCAADLDAEAAGRLFEDIQQFAGYGFNKSHAVSYALVSLQTAYLKAHHPAVFYAASLSISADDIKSQELLLQDAREMGIEVLPPCVNSSAELFVPEGRRGVRFGLSSIKDVGLPRSQAIVAERERNGAYKDLYDLCLRCEPRLFNQRALESLVNSGACDRLGPAGQEPRAVRPRLKKTIEAALEQSSFEHRHANQENLFEADASPAAPAALAACEPSSLFWTLIYEKRALGATISGSFYDNVKWLLDWIGKINAASPLDTRDSGLWAGLVHRIFTSARSRLGGRAEFKIKDASGVVDVEASTEDLQGFDLGETGLVVIVEGKAVVNNGRAKIKASRVDDLESWCRRHLRQVLLDARGKEGALLDWLGSELRGAAQQGPSFFVRVGNQQGSAELDIGKHSVTVETLQKIRERGALKDLRFDR